MRIAILLTLLLLLCPAAYGAEPGKSSPSPATAGRLSMTTATGAFTIDLSLRGDALAPGVNSVDLAVRDKAGKGVGGAKVVVTPWMPSQGHGVWDKPEVTEQGGGKYHVENIKIALEGRWELKVSIRSGAVEDRAVFPFSVGGPGAPAGQVAKPKGYKRAVAYYKLPDVTLLNQDGRRIKLRSLVDAGKPVVVDFIYTTCTTICPILSSEFASITEELGDKAAESVQLISISIDPENDRPEQMKEYLSRYTTGEGWDFLTGSKDDIGKVLRAFDSVVVDKMAHEPILLFHSPGTDEWIRVEGLIGQADLMREFRNVAKR